MYSMVLLAALTAGGDAPDWGRRGWGCCGCYGGWGGYGMGGYGYGGYGWGRGWGGWGVYGLGGWGYGMGGYGMGRWGGLGYAYAPMFPTFPGPLIVSNPLPTNGVITRSLYYNPASTLVNENGNRATIVAHLPADAVLIVNGERTTSSSSTRRFYSPPLDPNKNYVYTFKAQLKRNGRTETTEKRVQVHAGKSAEVYLQFPEIDQATKGENSLDRPTEKRDLPKKPLLPDQP